jgi:hypothetical protein
VVPDKAERVFNFHQNTLHALQELVQAAGLQHPREITTRHIVRRTPGDRVTLLANCLPTVQPGELLAAERGERPGRSRSMSSTGPWRARTASRPGADAGLSPADPAMQTAPEHTGPPAGFDWRLWRRFATIAAPYWRSEERWRAAPAGCWPCCCWARPSST